MTNEETWKFIDYVYEEKKLLSLILPSGKKYFIKVYILLGQVLWLYLQTYAKISSGYLDLLRIYKEKLYSLISLFCLQKKCYFRV